MSEIDRFKKMLARGELKEAAEWIKEGPSPFFDESELRAALTMLADAILDDKARPGKFHGQKRLPADYNGKSRRVSQQEWERQIHHAVKVRTDDAGRVKPGAYDDVAERFATGRDNVKAIYQRMRKQAG